MSNSEKELKEKIQQLILQAIEADKELREQYQIGDKFRFIRDRLQAMSSNVQEELNALVEEIQKKAPKVTEDELLVYVYLFNAHGLVFQTWHKMLSPSVFYEYSVNRPIYTEKAHVESFIRSRTTKAQHGYLTFAIKKADLFASPPGEEAAKDQVGNPLFKIREGSLKVNRMLSFSYQDNEYELNAAGQVVKKTEF